MKTTRVQAADLQGVFAVPPLARKNNPERSIDLVQNDLILAHIKQGGITRVIYGGNAFLYHTKLGEFDDLLQWLSRLSDELWVIPSIGSSYGFAIEQAGLVRRHQFPCVMVLPCGDPRDAKGLERGYREIADRAETKLMVYLKDENNFGQQPEAGLDAVARLVSDGVCAGIKYAVVREDPSKDAYLDALLDRVDRSFVISGIGERPAVIHLRDWNLPGFTTGSGCIAPTVSRKVFEACARHDYDQASMHRAKFLPLEDLRDAWGPAKVLHAAVSLAAIAETGSMPPYLSTLSAQQLETLTPVAEELVALERFNQPATQAIAHD